LVAVFSILRATVTGTECFARVRSY